MSVPLLDDPELIRAWGLVRGSVSSADEGDDRARMIWSIITEPGDPIAGVLLAHLGAVEALQLLSNEKLLSETVGVSARLLRQRRLRWRQRASLTAVCTALERAQQCRAEPVLPTDSDWPQSLNDLGDHAPVLLWVRGQRSVLAAERSMVSLVGARAATGYGDHLARELSGDLAGSGAVPISGGAYGIDGSVHRAALSVGRTVAILAGGLDRDQPAGHHALFRQIEQSGALLSETPCGTAPTAHRFLSRNRLIGALGRATVVVEAGWRSGSLNTAGHAASLGRPLGAVPGPVTSPVSAGCHRLLREYNARCVTSAEEVRELIQEGGGRLEWDEQDCERDPAARVLWAVLGARTARSALELAGRAGLTVEAVQAQLGLWDIEGRVQRTGSGWRRSPDER